MKGCGLVDYAHVMRNLERAKCTNLLVAIYIRCEGVNLNHILQAFLATRTRFPMKYLGLPLSVALKRIHFQPLEDKVAAKLLSWLGKHITMAERATRVK
jgi:hypothetical protein